MSTLDRAKQAIKRISGDQNGFGIDVTFTALDSTTATVKAIHTKHHLGIDTDGAQMNSKTAHVAVSEESLILAGYTVRNIKGEVEMLRHKVDVVDSTGIVKHYQVRECYPDETVGLIVCILSDYA